MALQTLQRGWGWARCSAGKPAVLWIPNWSTWFDSPPWSTKLSISPWSTNRYQAYLEMVRPWAVYRLVTDSHCKGEVHNQNCLHDHLVEVKCVAHHTRGWPTVPVIPHLVRLRLRIFNSFSLLQRLFWMNKHPKALICPSDETLQNLGFQIFKRVLC